MNDIAKFDAFYATAFEKLEGATSTAEVRKILDYAAAIEAMAHSIKDRGVEDKAKQVREAAEVKLG